MSQLIAFQTYSSIEEANEVAEKLNQEGITTEIITKAPPVRPRNNWQRLFRWLYIKDSRCRL